MPCEAINWLQGEKEKSDPNSPLYSNRIAEKEQWALLRIKIPNAALNQMKDKRLVRSPIYQSTVIYGEASELDEKVEWNL